jgi:hypothetical protein
MRPEATRVHYPCGQIGRFSCGRRCVLDRREATSPGRPAVNRAQSTGTTRGLAIPTPPHLPLAGTMAPLVRQCHKICRVLGVVMFAGLGSGVKGAVVGDRGPCRRRSARLGRTVKPR